MNVYSNFPVVGIAQERLCAGLSGCTLVPSVAQADVAFGQPDAAACLAAPRLRWVHLSSAGYTALDTPDIRAHFRSNGIVLTNSSTVFSEPCAQHVLAFLLMDVRACDRAAENWLGARAWPTASLRRRSRILGARDTVLLVGWGAIALRLSQLLAPFGARVIGFRRSPTGKEPVEVHPIGEIERFLPDASIVVNILPANADSAGFFDTRRFDTMKPGATFVNIGRGSTVDQTALLAQLVSGRLRAAFLDVTDPEPLPPDHPLWSTPGCFISPHTAGGHDGEFERLVDHFLENLAAYSAGKPLRDRVF